MRQLQTPAEKSLWYALRAKRFQNHKFRRQHTIGPYTVDIFSPKSKLIIEVDGEIHNDISQEQYDAARDLYLKQLGYHTLRFENNEILECLECVLTAIEEHLIID